MSSSADLKALLLDGRNVTDRLLARLDDPAVEPADVVSLLDALTLVEQRKRPVVEALRAEASTQRRREDERSIRQYVLRSLDEIGVPQTAGFLGDYLYARDLVMLKTRGMGALRRDEYRAWDRLRRSGKPRVAYIVPCLDETGGAVARWMARSDWELRNRVVVEGVEELWETHRVRVLIDAYASDEPEATARFLPLIEQYAIGVLGEEVGTARVNSTAWIKQVRNAADRKIAALERAVERNVLRAATRLEKVDEPKRLWGGDDR